MTQPSALGGLDHSSPTKLIEIFSSPASNTVAIPVDDPRRNLVVANPDNSNAQHLAVVGDTYPILLSGMDTAGRFTLIDMHVPPGGGPPPHRHDFEETFILLDGELQATFRGEKRMVRAGETIHATQEAAFIRKAMELAPKYRTELLKEAK